MIRLISTCFLMYIAGVHGGMWFQMEINYQRGLTPVSAEIDFWGELDKEGSQYNE